MEFRTGPARVRFALRGFPSGPRTPRRRSLLYGKVSGSRHCLASSEPLLVRVPGTDLHMYGTLWLLTQGDTRKTKRVRLFTEFVSHRLAGYAPLLAGLSISRD